MFFGSSFGNLFSTHPTNERRIAALRDGVDDVHSHFASGACEIDTAQSEAVNPDTQFRRHDTKVANLSDF